MPRTPISHRGRMNRVIYDPLNHIDHYKLRDYVRALHKTHFAEDGLVDEFDLWIGALLAKKFNNHDIPPPQPPDSEVAGANSGTPRDLAANPPLSSHAHGIMQEPVSGLGFSEIYDEPQSYHGQQDPRGESSSAAYIYDIQDNVDGTMQDQGSNPQFGQRNHSIQTDSPLVENDECIPPTTASDAGSSIVEDNSPPRIRPTRRRIDSTADEIHLLDRKVWERIDKRLKAQESKKIWLEPKDLLVTLATCCLASLTQGWDQVANGNLGWPHDFHITTGPKGQETPDFFKFGLANAATWYSAAIFGFMLVDPVSHGTRLGRRWTVGIAAGCSLISVLFASMAPNWGVYLICRILLGIGIGAKASIVPIWESEILPKAKRGRLLALWQVFTATGILAGSIATYICKDNWRHQVLTGVAPAAALLLGVFLSSESPRWLILRGKYSEALVALERLRGDRILALEELCFLHFQLRAEKAHVLGESEPNYEEPKSYVRYKTRAKHLFKDRNRRAAIVTLVVMMSQQLSGVNILAFLSTVFLTAAGLRPPPTSTDPNEIAAASSKNEHDSLRLTIYFGLADALFSCLAYFAIEPRRNDSGQGARASRWRLGIPSIVRGRKRLLLSSLLGGSATLFALAMVLRLPSTNDSKYGAVIALVILFTFFHAPGTGAVPFAYSAEVWPNQWREIGMSWAVAWNFIGAGSLAFAVPKMLEWGVPGTFATFALLSLFGFWLVYLIVPDIPPSMTLEAVSLVLEEPTLEYARRKLGLSVVENTKTPTGIPLQRIVIHNGHPSTPAAAHTAPPAPQALTHTARFDPQAHIYAAQRVPHART